MERCKCSLRRAAGGVANHHTLETPNHPNLETSNPEHLDLVANHPYGGGGGLTLNSKLQRGGNGGPAVDLVHLDGFPGDLLDAADRGRGGVAQVVDLRAPGRMSTIGG